MKYRIIKPIRHTNANVLDLPFEIWETEIFPRIPWMKSVLQVTCKVFKHLSQRIPDPKYKWRYLEQDKEPRVTFMEYLVNNGCVLNSSIFVCAAERGYLNIMKWLKENGCPWGPATFAYAAKYGNLDNMKWLKENGCPWDKITPYGAIQSRNPENIEWLKENGCPGFNF